jgi:hypothetical protein
MLNFELKEFDSTLKTKNSKLISIGGMAERPKAAVLKTVGRLRAPWVRILLPPPISYGDLICQQSAIKIF